MKSVLLLTALLAAAPASATIRRAVTIADVFAASREDSVIALDLDHTVIRAVGDEGSDAHYDLLVQRHGLARAIQLWEAMQSTTPVVTVEPDVVPLIARVQTARRRILGLTARPRSMAGVTAHQLATVGIDFSAAPLATGPIELSAEALFTGGILYVGPTLDKGRALLLLFEHLRLRARHVVFADDKDHYTSGVDAALSAAGIEIDSFRYGGADEFVRGFWSRACTRDVTDRTGT